MSWSSNKIYGIKVRFSNGQWETYWYGTDRSKRDRKHNEYVKKSNVLVVRDVSMRP